MLYKGQINCGVVLLVLGSQLYRTLLVASEVHGRKRELYDADSRRIDDRIVNLSKPHVRPIVRGKAGKKTEFGGPRPFEWCKTRGPNALIRV